MVRSAIPVLLCILLQACGGTRDRAAEEGWQAAVDTLGDTVRVRTLAGSVWGDTAALVEEVSIGKMDGPDEYVFGDPYNLAVAADGTILVLDVQVPVVRAYATDGTYLHDIGRDGSGPGEYKSPDGIGVLPDGRILVRDPPNARIAVFQQDGAYVGQWHLDGGFNSGERQFVDREGNSYVTTILERAASPWNWRFGLIRYGPEGEVTDTMAAPTWDYDVPQVTASSENSQSVRTVPFSPEVSWAFSPMAYMVGGLSTDYRIDIFRPSGQVLRIEKEGTPVPVTAEEAEAARGRIVEGFRRQYGSWSWNGPGVPDVKPPFKDIMVSDEGDLWVLLSTPGVAVLTEAEAREEAARTGRTPVRFREPVAFDVFSPDGRYLGPVRVPDSFRARPEPVFRGAHVWAVTRDELDVPRVVRFRIEGR